MFALAAIALGVVGMIAPIEEQAPELGRVAWRRELDKLLAKDALTASSKPVLVLFQEVPG